MLPETGCAVGIRDMDIDTCVISPLIFDIYATLFWYVTCVISFDSSCFDYYCCVGMPQIKNSRKQV